MGNKGFFTFRPNSISVTKVTVLAGCQFPTYNALLTGAKEAYVTTQDVTYELVDGEWVLDDGLKAGEYDTSVEAVTYARDKATNWMMFRLSNRDYPNAGETFNIATTEEEIGALNFYDNVTVDGYSLRALIEKNGYPIEAPKINLWQADCFAVRVSGAEGALDGA